MLPGRMPRGPPRSERITAPSAPVCRRSWTNARRKSGWSGMVRPLPFLAALSCSSMRWPMRRSASSTIDQVSLAISTARRPALTESRIMTRSRCGYRPRRARRKAATTCWRVRILACFPAMARAPASILFDQHHGHHPLGDGRITGIGGMVGEVVIVVVDFEQHPAPRHGQDGAVVLAPGVVVLGELIEARHRQQYGTKVVRSERLDAAGDDDATAGGLAAQLIVQLADAGRFHR